MSTPTLKVGDTVLWRGRFGDDLPAPVTVLAISRCEHWREKDGKDVPSIPWNEILYACVDLSNGHWAYGDQLSPAEPGERIYASSVSSRAIDQGGSMADDTATRTETTEQTEVERTERPAEGGQTSERVETTRTETPVQPSKEESDGA